MPFGNVEAGQQRPRREQRPLRVAGLHGANTTRCKLERLQAAFAKDLTTHAALGEEPGALLAVTRPRRDAHDRRRWVVAHACAHRRRGVDARLLRKSHER
eukprot:3486549-Prymnesium_polylepis.1